ncbi:MAG: polar amino acid transport system substrate-binding protein [Desulforhopalus sp.]
MNQFATFFIILLASFSVFQPISTFAEQGKSQLLVAYEPDLAPLNYSRQGTAEGFTVDLLTAIFQDQNIDITFIPMVQDEALRKIASREIDIIASISYASQHTNIIEHSDQIFSSSIGVLAPVAGNQDKDFSSLSNMIVALQSNTLEYDFLKNVRRIHYQVSNSQKTALRFFLAGRADVFVGNIATAKYYLNQYGINNRYEFSNSYLMPVEYSFAVPKNNFRLLSTINNSIRQMKITGEYSNLYRKWFNQEAEAISGIVRMVWKVGLGVISIFIMVFLLGMRWNRQLKKEVARKTVDLQEVNEALVKQITIAQNNNEFLKQILDSSPRGIIILDRQGRITKSNKKVYSFLDLTGSLKGKHYQDISLFANLLDAKITPLLSGQSNHFLGEHKELMLSDTRMHHLRYNVSPLYQYDQKINGIILSFEDVTSELEIRNKLFEQEKTRALSRVVAGIAHEIRNPLSAIKTFAELIPRKIHSVKFQQEISNCVPKEIIRINILIEGLINYARPRKVKTELVSVKKVIDESTILLEHGIRNKGFLLRREISENLSIMTDHDQIKQVIINLIINAIDALKEAKDTEEEYLDGTIELKAFSERNQVCIQVIDNGIGMDLEEKSNALEPFFTTKPRGTGLGLPLADQLIRQNNGWLKLKSEKNIGTTISMYFNRAETRQPHE